MEKSPAYARLALNCGSLACLGRAALCLSPVLALTGCAHGVLQPRGPIGAANAEILLDAVAIMSVIVVPTMIATLVFAWWFRASNARARYLPGFVYSGRLEIINWAIPVLVITFLGAGLTWLGSHDLDPFVPISSPTKPMKVQVVSLDWKWLFIYPDHGVASVNELVVPVAVPVHFSLTSATVMNSFFVPQLGSMIATMNGMVTQLHLQADHIGNFFGLSTQFSGDGFSGMHFIVRAVTADAFTQWLDAARGTGPALDRASYEALLKQSRNVAPYTYRSVEPNLFQAIATQEIPPGPGPGGGGGEPTPSPIGNH